MLINKNEFRKQQLAKLRDFSQSYQKLQEDQFLQEKLIATSDFKNSVSIGITISTMDEIDTKLIINTAWQFNKQVFIPRCLSGRRMEFTQITDYNRLTKNKFGILENWQSQSTINNEPDIIIVPGLAFKSDGYRLGFGGGYYDRFLAEHDLMSISMVGSLRLIEQSCWSINDYDIPVKKLITIE